jgi:uncharacterized protein (UPF0210 family)
MKIRALTFGAGLHEREPRGALIATLGHAAGAARAAYADAGLEVQTVRLATPPLPQLLAAPGGAANPVRLAQDLEASCQEAGIGFCALGPVPAERAGASLSLIPRLPDVIAATTNVFASVQVGMAERNPDGSLTGYVNLGAVQRAAEAVRAISQGTPDGLGNMRFAALANCPPHIPFFPAAYYLPDADSRPTLSLAIEAADLALAAFAAADTLAAAHDNLVRALEEASSRICPIAARIAGEYRLRFAGLDLSLAPTPGPEQSIGRAFERLAGAPFGTGGTLAMAAFFTGALRAAQVPRTGFSGLMLPVLEDDVLAASAAAGTIDVHSLLLYSTVCGLGLDTVPLPGAVTTAQLAGLITDMAALAVRLDKPLTARLMPVPGKAAGEAVEWDFFSVGKGRVMAVRPHQGGGLLDAALQAGEMLTF